MTGSVCLQGGAEFGARCREMDAEVLASAEGSGRDGPVVVVALAAGPGHDHDATLAHAIAYYSSLGDDDVLGAPDARDEPQAARALVASARLVVLPGGSPFRLLTALREARLDDALRELVAAGGVVSGASAGAMVACEWTLLPESGTPELVRGLGLVPGALVLPHYTGDRLWLDAVADELDESVVVLGLPECTGVLVDAGPPRTVRTVGDESVHLLGARDVELAPGTLVAL